MNEEECFCKLFPEYVVNGKPLSPYFDLFESGYEQAENRIAELKEKAGCIIEDLKALYFSPVVTKNDLKRQDKILAEAEQFLRDYDIDNAIQQANKGLDFDKIADEMEKKVYQKTIINILQT